ncbi:MAG: carboxypeptidase regulatory-like domain-containing protein [Bacteroidia bacterium]|nr:carboxypeptidase regulatory-like domain-containing protein [Bacteroidia bacterium]
MKTIKKIMMLAFIGIAGSIQAQDLSIVKGTVLDENGAPMLFATVALLDDTVLVGGTTTDDKGYFIIKSNNQGEYNLKASYTGYNSQLIKRVKLDAAKVAQVNFKLNPSTNMLTTVETIGEYKESIINPTYSTVTAISHDQIEHMAATKGDIVSIITAVTPGVLATDDGKDLYVRGSRSGSTLYFVDGNKVIGSPAVPGMGISGMEVLTGGVPAEYGDCTGGLVIITTKEYKMEMRRKEIKKRNREESRVEASMSSDVEQ